jgi:cobalt-precorrin-6B (C15)-methyltransferase
MPESKLSGGPTQDEILAVSLFKLGLISTDTVLEIGCGSGKVSVALAKMADHIYSLDKRPDAITVATRTAGNAGIHNIEFFCMDARDFLKNDQVFDCAFVGGSKNLAEILPVLAKKVKRTIVINAVLVSTLEQAVAILKDLGIFTEVVQVQVSRSYDIAGSIMFRPINPVYIIIARGAVCS